MAARPYTAVVTLGHLSTGISVVMPCLNDWHSSQRVLEELADLSSDDGPVNVFVVDDGSTESMPPGFGSGLGTHVKVTIVRLESNLGHQRALCVGLIEAIHADSFPLFILMDSDGEDRPADIPRLLEALNQGQTDAVVASRGKRHSGNAFKALNRLFQILFRVLTGNTLNFGNFMVLTLPTAIRLANTADSWNNIPTSLMRSRVSIGRTTTDRGQRHAGDSRLGLVGLINHGLGAISVYSDVVFARILVASLAALVGSALVSVTALITRLISGSPLPGWFALGTTAVALGSVVVVVLVTLLTFSTLENRRVIAPPLPHTARQYVAARFSVPLRQVPPHVTDT